MSVCLGGKVQAFSLVLTPVSHRDRASCSGNLTCSLIRLTVKYPKGSLRDDTKGQQDGEEQVLPEVQSLYVVQKKSIKPSGPQTPHWSS